jgi:hypothetical protein
MTTSQPTLDDVWLLFKETNLQFKETNLQFKETDRKFQETDLKIQETNRSIKELSASQKDFKKLGGRVIFLSIIGLLVNIFYWRKEE